MVLGRYPYFNNAYTPEESWKEFHDPNRRQPQAAQAQCLYGKF